MLVSGGGGREKTEGGRAQVVAGLGTGSGDVGGKHIGLSWKVETSLGLGMRRLLHKT